MDKKLFDNLSRKVDAIGAKAGKNIQAEPLYVTHAELEKLDPTMSDFRVRCPVCEDGLLLVSRDQVTLEILEFDRCVLCGQVFLYKDIEDLRAIGGQE